jgi:aspartyl-tRNA(Asn)/glutamyl-tRNA(Gln) amidotransferase subunit B
MIVDEAGREKRIGLTRAHIEEDAGKLVHDDDPKGPSYIDFNRCGVPLLEIVTEPDIRTPEEAERFLLAVKEIMQYTGVSACNMEKGELRVDVNISLRKGGGAFGVKQEIKNMNSFANVKRALEYEIKRQTRMLRSGESLAQETRLFDPQKNATVLMRTKEEAQDYRYFPDPDLVPIVVTDDYVREIGDSLAELPEERRRRFMEEYRLTEYDAINLCSSRMLADFFEETCERFEGEAKTVSNWLMGDVMSLLNDAGVGIGESPIACEDLAELLALIEDEVISGKIAKDVLETMFETGRAPSEIVEDEGLEQISDTGELEAIVEQVIADNPGPADDVRAGTEKAIGFLVGQVMQQTQGQANPQMVNEMLREKLM